MIIVQKYRGRHEVLKQAARIYQEKYIPDGDIADYMVSRSKLKDKVTYTEEAFERNGYYI